MFDETNFSFAIAKLIDIGAEAIDCDFGRPTTPLKAFEYMNAFFDEASDEFESATRDLQSLWAQVNENGFTPDVLAKARSLQAHTVYAISLLARIAAANTFLQKLLIGVPERQE